MRSYLLISDKTNENPVVIKIPITFFTELEKAILNNIWYRKRSRITKTILSKKGKIEGIIGLSSKLYKKATMIKNSMILEKKNTVFWINGADITKLTPGTPGYAILHKGS